MTTYDPDVVQGTVLDRAEIDRQIELYRGLDAAGRRDIPGLQPARAEVILAGACIVRTIIDKLGLSTRSPSATAACGTACSTSASGRARRRESEQPTLVSPDLLS